MVLGFWLLEFLQAFVCSRRVQSIPPSQGFPDTSVPYSSLFSFSEHFGIAWSIGHGKREAALGNNIIILIPILELRTGVVGMSKLKIGKLGTMCIKVPCLGSRDEISGIRLGPAGERVD